MKSFEFWIYRKVLKIAWYQRISNQEVLQLMDIEPYISNAIKCRTVGYFGHLIRKNDLQRQLLEGRIEGKRPRGRPRQDWLHNIKQWCDLQSYGSLVRKAEDRSAWKERIIKAVNHKVDDDTR